MALSTNPFLDLDPADLQSLKTVYVQAIASVAVTGGSYTMNGRTFTSANLKDLEDTLFSVNQAIKSQAGRVRRTAYPDMSRADGRMRGPYIGPTDY